ncbi:helix-turn-helix domain-containing protein [Kitasatospora sp. NPDC052868]|uniref:helix-turn-helix domain-containing protein n=1 Tax=Kitasatospora sp. NPDC052868 TaxID=3364060 RepID=UPI0037C76723
MGRRENAVAKVTDQLTDLALWLRAQRQNRNLTYAAMAEKTDYTASMLSRAASGATVPSWRIVEAYTRACQGDLRTAHRHWKAARWAEQHRRRRERTDEIPLAAFAAKYYNVFATKPQLIDDFTKLRVGMIGLRAKGGEPSLEELQKRAGRMSNGGWRLPASSLSAVLRSEAVPIRRHVTALVTVMGEAPRTVRAWGEAWDRAAGKTRRRTGPGPHPAHRAPRTDAAPQPMRGFLLEGAEIRIADIPPQGRVPNPFADTTVRILVRTDTGTDPGAGAASGLKAEDVEFLTTHGLTVAQPRPGQPRSDIGPTLPLPPAGYTAAGLPIRVPRRSLPPPAFGGTAGPTLAWRH